MNLLKLTKNTINTVTPDESVTLYQNEGQVNVKGVIKPKYAAAVACKAQVQSVGDAVLAHADRVGQNDVTRQFYLMASSSTPPAGVLRPLARGGDMLQRANGTWWLVIAVPDDFSATGGWVCVRCSLQVVPPDFSASSWFTEGEQ